eukprot:CAMPEP_0184679314 /NCGR_PEP_ID=MMETSP0312-20130426/2150_1 /TAXON_ID=31354 /ORGANISM="Compsopogon coeruleus, Strain SAG 36.94" /LENGTH=1681 /DNA_ID=CAMNT_0027128683 /DNA_START=608 /DNA_END=5649 /DNA_ORIENTATION=-
MSSLATEEGEFPRDGGFSEAYISVRIVSIDHYMSRIDQHAEGSSELQDALRDLPRSLRRNKVPVVRIFGSTPAGQKCCIHLHGVLPYFYIPLPNAMKPEEAWNCADRIHSTLERAMASSTTENNTENQKSNEDSEDRFVFEVTPLTRTSIYGFHEDQIFLKVTAFNPSLISRLANLCSSGSLIEFGPLQPFESHISFSLQTMVDLNLVGMGYINLRSVKFRLPLPHEAPVSGCGIFPVYTSELLREARSEQFWSYDMRRRARTELECDAFVLDVLNRVRIERDSDSSPPFVKVFSLVELWEDEKSRRVARLMERGMSFETAQTNTLESLKILPDNRVVQPGFHLSTKSHQEHIKRLRCQSEAQPAPILPYKKQLVSSGSDQDKHDNVWQSAYHSQRPASRPARELPVDDVEEIVQYLVQNAESTTRSPLMHDSDYDVQYDGVEPEHEALNDRDGEVDVDLGASIIEDNNTLEEETVSVPDECQPTAEGSRHSVFDQTPPTETKEKPSIETAAWVDDKKSSTFLQEEGDGEIEQLMHFVDTPINMFDSWDEVEGVVEPHLLRQTQAVVCLVPAKKPPTVSELQRDIPDSFCSTVTPIPHYSSRKDANHAGSVTLLGREFRIPCGSPGEYDEAQVLVPGGQKSSKFSAERKVVTPSRYPPLGGELPDLEREERVKKVLQCRIDAAGRQVNYEVFVPKTNSASDHGIFPLSIRTFPAMKEDDLDLLDFSIPVRESGGPPKQTDSDSEDELRLSRDIAVILGESSDDEDIPFAQNPPSPKYDESFGFRSMMLNQDRKSKRTALHTRISPPEPRDSEYSNEISALRDTTAARTLVAQEASQGSVNLHESQNLSYMVVEIIAQSRTDLLPDPRIDPVRAVVLHSRRELGSCDEELVEVISFPPDRSWSQSFLEVENSVVSVVESEQELFDLLQNRVLDRDPDILFGWDVQRDSLGYLLERSQCIGGTLETSVGRFLEERVAHQRGSEVENHPGITYFERLQSGINILGRHVVNIWKSIRSEVKLTSYTFEAVCSEVLRERVPRHSPQQLSTWFSESPATYTRALAYVCRRTSLCLRILENVDVIGRTGELARVFGLDFMSVITRGSQFRVESVLARTAHREGYLLLAASREQVFRQPALEVLPLVMEPDSSYYTDPVIVLDFQSLYPSIIISHNLCFSTMLGSIRVDQWSQERRLGVVSDYVPPSLSALGRDVFVSPNGQVFVTREKRRGVLPQMLEDILNTRIMVKQSMKEAKAAKAGQSLLKLLNSRQFGLKMIANVTYGYASASFSGRMPSSPLADSIVQCGHSALHDCVGVIEEKWFRHKARVVYGDTDSLFVLLPGANKCEAFAIGQEIASHISDLYPSPMKLQLEKVYIGCILATKKRYVGHSYESPDQNIPTFDAKGIETVRRDSCGATRRILERSLRVLFETHDLSRVKRGVQRQFSRILAGHASIEDFIFRQEVRLGTYKEGAMPPAALVAAKARDRDPRADPAYGERVGYVVVYGPPQSPLKDLVVAPEVLLEGQRTGAKRLNATYYITKQIIPALSRCFNLLGANVQAWFTELPRPYFTALSSSTRSRESLRRYFPSARCPVCAQWSKPGRARARPRSSSELAPDVVTTLCGSCMEQPQNAFLHLTALAHQSQERLALLDQLCRHCSRAAEPDQVLCSSLDCTLFFARHTASVRAR